MKMPKKSFAWLTGLAVLLLAVGCDKQPVAVEEEAPAPSLNVTAGDPGSHFRYGTLSWAPTGNPGEVIFRLRAAFRRNSNWGPVNTGAIITETQGPTRFKFGDGSPETPTLKFIITAHSLTENWVIAEALNPNVASPTGSDRGIPHTYFGSGPFTAFLSGPLGGACCRIGQFGLVTLNNRSGSQYPLETDVFPQSGNSSPVSSMVPIVVVPPSTNAQFLVPGADPDGDPIQWRLSTDAEAGGPSHPPNLTVNSSTGLVTWDNVSSPGPLSQTGFWTTQIVVEDQETKTPVDFLLTIKPQVGSLPACAINPPGPLTAVVGSPVSFTVTATDADPGATVELNSGGLPAGASMNPGLPVTGSSPQSSAFSWTPTGAQEGAHVVLFSATDNDGQQGLCSITINVIRVIQVNIDIKPASDPNSINTKNRGTIPVAILSTPDFDATQVDKESLTFGKTGDEASLAKCTKSNEDVNGDGLDDVVCHFNTQDTGFEVGDTEGILKGQTTDGIPIEGSDAVRIVK